MNYHHKLYALLRNSTDNQGSQICQYLSFLAIDELNQWWHERGYIADAIASSSDRVNLSSNSSNEPVTQLRHPISGERREIAASPQLQFEEIAGEIKKAFEVIRDKDKPEEDEENLKRLFWWCWRFLPKLLELSQINLLKPAHSILPDCPQHSYNSTVSALVGAMFAQQQQDESTHPYLLIFTFSPVQEFIKSSRKFLDFWAGSYLLHYFSAILCWEAAQQYGADAVITPSLWSQEIIDALLVDHYPEFQQYFEQYEYSHPVQKFLDKQSQSLCTAGFPNVITVLVPGKESAIQLGKDLEKTLKNHWYDVSCQVRKDVKETVISKVSELIKDESNQVLQEIKSEFNNSDFSSLEQELKQFAQGGCWEWNKLWDAQINHSWETYFVAVPLGNPFQELQVNTTDQLQWEQAQNIIAQPKIELPTDAERQAYTTMNVGSWWGSFQARLGNAIQAVKNTRTWQIPVASGERSTLSGQYSALHPRFLYQNFQNGLGLPSESMRLFWKVISLAYPGVFNGSEKLNAIELTKRLAWKHGGVATNLGVKEEDLKDDYEVLIRFPNLSSIAAANFTAHHPRKVQKYWSDLRQQIKNHAKLNIKHDEFCSRTRRPFQVQRADTELSKLNNSDNGYNGVMFASKWLADDMGLNSSEKADLRSVVDTVQKQHFGDGSPADWWVLVLGDGDGMGSYVSGSKLKNYTDYIVSELVDRSNITDTHWQQLLATKKRMGPATHVGLNRALLDFSNRLVPYITEQRFCGRVIYSGGDDVKAVLSLADLPEYLRSLRAAWCGKQDPFEEFTNQGGYWQWQNDNTRPQGIPNRPLFTMGKDATMSLGIVIAHKSVPLPTVLENIWEAEKDRAKKLLGGKYTKEQVIFPAKDGLCFRVIYGSGNVLEALMKGHLFEHWWKFIQDYQEIDFSPLLYRLAEELPRHADVTEDDNLFRKVAKVIIANRDQQLPKNTENALLHWLDAWEKWAYSARNQNQDALGTTANDMANLLKFSAFWVSRRRQEMSWEK
ncbi:MAG: type III-B CRISPR-associated protein Cas10/Cmr2 [Richelia sp. RM1_1_1]|nr:type III-B CRISPR-associated protein Cas10/Cmr2 [Richelia sp. RM1_1_1]